MTNNIKESNTPNDDFILVDNHMINGDLIPEFKQIHGKILVKHYIGINTDNFHLKKAEGSEFKFSFFKINGIYYINVDSHHIIDYKKFTNIQQIIKENENVKIRSKNFGEIIVENCDLDLVKKGLSIMDEFIKARTSFWQDLLNYIIN